jgi:hypothetical protein
MIEILGLLAVGLSVSILHAALPSHWLPFVLVGSAQKWEQRKILRIALIAGSGHVITTSILGIAAALMTGFVLTSLNLVLLPVTSGILIIIGSIYIVLGYRAKRAAGKGHHHHVPDNATATSLILMLTLTPCEALIPIFLSANSFNLESLLLFAVIISFATVGAILLLVFLTLKGYERIHSHWLERNDRIVVGSALIILGILVFVFHLLGI